MLQTDQARQLEMFVQIAQVLVTLDLDEVLLRIIKLTTDTVNAARGSFFLMDEQGNNLQRFIAARNLDPQMKQAVSDRVLRSGLAGWVIANLQPAIVVDTFTDERWVTLSDDTEYFRVRSAMCVPFFARGQLRGVMTLEHPEPNHFKQEDLRLVEAVANQAAAALRNAQLFDRVQSQQRQLEAVLNSIHEPLMVVDMTWHIRMINPAARELFGPSIDPVDNLTLNEISARTENDIFSRLIEEIRSNPVRDGLQNFEVRDSISGRDYAVQVATLHGLQTLDSGYVIAMHDVTTLKDLSRLKTHMIQMASHDLKNPIGVLRGYLDVIRHDRENGHLPEPLFLENMYKALTRMETLVATLLDIQRAEQNSPMNRESIDANELVQAALDDMTPIIQPDRHTLTTNIQPGMGSIKGDFTRLREVMNNLIENAIKYTPAGGKITVAASMEDERFSFSVKDTGIGIPGDQQGQVFQPYFRAKQPVLEGIAGSGVGLSLVKEIIERHGGQVWFSSIENHGSTFGFWIPLLI